MILWLLSYLGGLLTILSPCILPVLPFVFSRAGQPFRQSTLPLLAGMATSFVAVSTLAVVGGGWVVHANQWGRIVALTLLSMFALSLLSPALSEMMTRPFTRLGGRLQQGSQESTGPGRSFILGIATGFLWAPCAGPILGLILTGAALRGASANTSLLLLAYALGAATSLGLALAAGGKLLGSLRTYLGADALVRKCLGIAVLISVVAIARGWDRGILTRLSRVKTEALEEKLLTLLHRDSAVSNPTVEGEGVLVSLNKANAWLNSTALTSQNLKGKVVLIDFWTYSCINCIRTLPYVKAWSEKYKAAGLVVIGVHTPEFAFEKEIANVQRAIRELGITYPVAIDNDYAIWNAFSNRYWPAHYFIDGAGKIRSQHFGEGNYEESEKTIQSLLKEIHPDQVPAGITAVKAGGAQAPGLRNQVQSHETYIGSDRAENQVDTPYNLELNEWSLLGKWSTQPQYAELTQASGKIFFRFQARDLHLVLGPGKSKEPIRFVVRMDGKTLGNNHGTDTDAMGRGVVREERLYQLIRQKGSAEIQDRTFEIEFLDPGVQAFAFTFG